MCARARVCVCVCVCVAGTICQIASTDGGRRLYSSNVEGLAINLHDSSPSLYFTISDGSISITSTSGARSRDFRCAIRSCWTQHARRSVWTCLREIRRCRYCSLLHAGSCGKRLFGRYRGRVKRSSTPVYCGVSVAGRRRRRRT